MRVTVLTGGTSSERAVALASAVQVVAALRARGHEVAVVDTARGYIPEAQQPSALAGTVATEPPPLAELPAVSTTATSWPRARSAATTCTADASATARSEDVPPVRTVTRI